MRYTPGIYWIRKKGNRFHVLRDALLLLSGSSLFHPSALTARERASECVCVCAARRENMVLKTCRFEHSAKHKFCLREQLKQETSILQRHRAARKVYCRAKSLSGSCERREYKCGRDDGTRLLFHAGFWNGKRWLRVRSCTRGGATKGLKSSHRWALRFWPKGAD